MTIQEINTKIKQLVRDIHGLEIRWLNESTRSEKIKVTKTIKAKKTELESLRIERDKILNEMDQ